MADIDACYRDWKAKGANFVTGPFDRVAELRCYMRDPDGYLIEVGQATGMLEGKFAKSGPRTCPAEGYRPRSAPGRGGCTVLLVHDDDYHDAGPRGGWRRLGRPIASTPAQSWGGCARPQLTKMS